MGCQELSWPNIEGFFEFTSAKSTEKCPLEKNIQRLIELQLGSLSGQNLWKAFLYLNKRLEEKKLTFKFVFAASNDLYANISLAEYRIDNVTEKKTIYFKINCHQSFFAQEFSEIFEVNMLCRPCLIKLNGKYHLREQPLPFFITLAHEFLHALNQLERIDKVFSESNFTLDPEFSDKIDSMLPMQEFLCDKLKILPTDSCLQKEYKELWQNYASDDSLDEMTVILGSNRKISESEEVFIGETTFLQESCQDESIISWTHFEAHNSKCWQQAAPLLEKNYVKEVLEKFSKPTPCHIFYPEMKIREQFVTNIKPRFNPIFNFGVHKSTHQYPLLTLQSMPFLRELKFLPNSLHENFVTVK